MPGGPTRPGRGIAPDLEIQCESLLVEQDREREAVLLDHVRHFVPRRSRRGDGQEDHLGVFRILLQQVHEVRELG